MTQRPVLAGAAALAVLATLAIVILVLSRRSARGKLPGLVGDPAAEAEFRPAPSVRAAGLQVSVQQAVLGPDGLLVQWQAFNPGPDAVQLFWGQPALSTHEAGVLELRYAADPLRAASQEPQLRPAMPGDTLSRSIRVAVDRLRAAGPATKVAVVLGYAPAAGAGDFWVQQDLASSVPKGMEIQGVGESRGHGA